MSLNDKIDPHFAFTNVVLNILGDHKRTMYDEEGKPPEIVCVPLGTQHSSDGKF